MPENDPQIKQFRNNLLASAKKAKAGIKASATPIDAPPVVRVRSNSGLSQSQFAVLMGVSVRTLQGSEQGRITPSGAAKTLLRVAEAHPEILRELVV